MTIVVTGGGSGGHITPVLAVASALKQLDPDTQIIYIGQTGDGLADVPAGDPNIDVVHTIQAGKLRRYHGEGLRQLLDLKTVILNVRDVFRTLRGIGQARRLLKRYKPEVVFIKGGFVGVPVGLAAARLHIPFVTHDSDAIPGLANRVIGRWARYHAVALPKELYAYEAAKTVTVGVPTSSDYEFVDHSKQAMYKQKLAIPSQSQVLFIHGGGLGAQRLNTALSSIMPELLVAQPALQVYHQAGRANEDAVQRAYEAKLSAEEQGRVHVIGYTTELFRYSGAADLIVTRAGATAIAEFAVQGRACILVPNPLLTGGHQLKNAEALQEAGAVAVLSEDSIVHDMPLVLSTVSGLLSDTATRRRMEKELHHFAHPDAATELAGLIVRTAQEAKEKG